MAMRGMMVEIKWVERSCGASIILRLMNATAITFLRPAGMPENYITPHLEHPNTPSALCRDGLDSANVRKISLVLSMAIIAPVLCRLSIKSLLNISNQSHTGLQEGDNPQDLFNFQAKVRGVKADIQFYLSKKRPKSVAISLIQVR
jgi:hypothetical protein